MENKIYASVSRKDNENELNITIVSKFYEKDRIDNIYKKGLSFKECADLIELLQNKHGITDIVIDEMGLSLGLKDEIEFRKSKKYKAYHLLEISIKNNVLIKTYERQIGKTTAIMKKCSEKGYTMIVKYHDEILKDLAEEMGLKLEIVKLKNAKDFRGKRLSNNNFLVDQNVDEEVIEELKSNGYILKGGFI